MMLLHRSSSGTSLTPVAVFMDIGESNTKGARNNLTELRTNYFTTDNNAFIWDDATSNTITPLIPGPQELQPGGAAYLDPAYTNTVGGGGAFIKRWRAINPSAPLYNFVSAQGGGRFSDASSRGRASNYTPTLSDGAYNEMKVSWQAFVSALAADGKTPNIIGCRINLGGNTSGDATETTNFASDFANFVTYLRNDIIGASTKIFIDRVSLQQTGLNGANVTTIRAAQVAYVNANPSVAELLDLDGCQILSAIPDTIHFNAGAHDLIGQRYFAQANGLWHPAKPQAIFSDPQYALRQWKLADGPATWAAGPVLTGTPNTANNTAAAFTQTTAANKPTISTRTLSSGLVAHFAVFDGLLDGSGDYLLGGSPVAINNSGGFIFYAAVKMPALNNGVLYQEANSGNGTPFWGVKSDGSGNACITLRDDANTVPLSLASLGVGAVFDNNWHTLIITYDGNTFTGYKDGVVGSTPQSYTKTPITLNNTALACHYVGGSVSSITAASIGEVGVMTYSSTGLSTLISNLNAYLTREYVS